MRDVRVCPLAGILTCYKQEKNAGAVLGALFADPPLALLAGSAVAEFHL